MADRVDIDVAQAAGIAVETKPPDVAEPACYDYGPDGRGLLRSRGEPRERPADTQIAVADVESGERPATGAAADQRRDGEGPVAGGVADGDVAGLFVLQLALVAAPSSGCLACVLAHDPERLAAGKESVIDRAPIIPFSRIAKTHRATYRSCTLDIELIPHLDIEQLLRG
jgi:hypothetical protein